MTALACAPALLEPPGGGPTLDELIVGVWEGLAAGRIVACVVCGGECEPAPPDGARGSAEHSGARGSAEHCGSGRGVAGGRCKTCGSSLG